MPAKPIPVDRGRTRTRRNPATRQPRQVFAGRLGRNRRPGTDALMANPTALAKEIVRALERAGDPQRARQQQAYMKSAMPFHGVPMPRLRTLVRSILLRHHLEDASAWQRAILLLWRRASHREQRYAAVEVLLAPAYRGWIVAERLPLIEELVVAGAWWDTVDAIAINAVGAMLREEPSPTKPVLRRWAEDDDIWKRRTAILAQLKFKDATDERLLQDVIEPSLGEREFFLRKGIGWALRQYSRTSPAFVVDYVRDHADRLSPLSKREALKALLKKGVVSTVP